MEIEIRQDPFDWWYAIAFCNGDTRFLHFGGYWVDKIDDHCLFSDRFLIEDILKVVDNFELKGAL